MVLIELLMELYYLGLDWSYVPVVGNPSTVLGTMMFAFTFVVTVPSWVNEKKEHVSVNKVLWMSTTFSTVSLVLLGFFGAWAIPNMTNSNVLNEISAVSATHLPRRGSLLTSCCLGSTGGCVHKILCVCL